MRPVLLSWGLAGRRCVSLLSIRARLIVTLSLQLIETVRDLSKPTSSEPLDADREREYQFAYRY